MNIKVFIGQLTSLLLIGVGGILVGVFCGHNKHVHNVYTIKTDGTDEYFDVENGTVLNGFKGRPSEYDESLSEYDLKCFSHHYDEFVIPSQINSINDYAFQPQEATFRDLTQPNGIKLTFESITLSIGSSAFQFCAGITSVDFSAVGVVTSIGEYAFDCCMLNNVVRGGDAVERITDNSWGSEFYVFGLPTYIPNYTSGWLCDFGCGGLAYGKFAPRSQYVNIGRDAFWGCAGITSVDFSSTITVGYIDQYAFLGCTLKEVIPGGGVAEYHDNTSEAIDKWGKDFHIFCLSSYEPSYTTNMLLQSGCGCLAYGKFVPSSNSNQAGTDIVIYRAAFMGCAGVTSVDFSKDSRQILTIQMQAFAQCFNINSFTFGKHQNFNNVTIGGAALNHAKLIGKVKSFSSKRDAEEILLKMSNNSNGSMNLDFWKASNK